MNDNSLIKELRGMAVETGSLVCLGCGYEHSCSVRGCAIINKAAERLEEVTGLSNVPLTLDELREMDGEPVWVERPGYGKRWALVQVWAKASDAVYLAYNNGSTLFVSAELDCGVRAYRQKPEEAKP